MSENQSTQEQIRIVRQAMSGIELMVGNAVAAASQCETKCECENWRKSMSDALEQIKQLTNAGHGMAEWTWQMLPNGLQVWNCQNYLTDEQMREWCELFEVPLPSQLKD